MPEWSIENNAYRPHFPVSTQPPREFGATFLDPFFLQPLSLEQATPLVYFDAHPHVKLATFANVAALKC